MSKVSCIYNGNLSYTLSFQSKSATFDANFKISCPDDFIYKPLSCYDGFLFAILFKAMQVGEDLYLDFVISNDALKNATYYIEAWHNLLPQEYKKIKLLPLHRMYSSSQHQDKNGVIAAFSGGVDASFTLIRHQEKDWGDASYHIQSVLSVHGFDIPSHKYDEYQKFYERVSPIFEQYHCQRFKIWTDLREKSQQDWEMSFSAQLASCLHLFSEHFNTALIASSEPYTDMFVPWGSTPATDFLLSGDAMRLVHDGAGYSRTEKVERISKNLAASTYIKVCWQNQSIGNCGQCEKCYRTRLNFMAVGVDQPACFDNKIQLAKIPAMKINSEPRAKELLSIMQYTKKHQVQQTWVFLSKLALMKWKIMYQPLSKIKQLRKKLKNKAK
jgi:hypothetical protein